MTSCKRVWWILIVLSLVLVGCGGKKEPTPTPVPPEVIAEGKKLYESSCSACHGPDAKGLPGLGRDLTTSEFAIGLSDAELVEFIKKGRPASDPANTTGVDMPPKGGNPALTDDQLQKIVQYIRTLEKR
ncbi:MAG: hypothetical protein Kow0047_11830 [Anaerolineae bacterium]